MPATSSRPDIHTFLDAYSVLEVEHSADPGIIRQAYKRLARQHHPDRYKPGSLEQRLASERMIKVNAAFQLIREAPLRHHRVSTRAQPDVPWAEAELDAAIQRARHERMFTNLAAVGLFVIFIFGGPLLAQALLGSGLSYQYIALLMVPFNILMMLAFSRGNGLVYLWRLVRIADVLFHFSAR